MEDIDDAARYALIGVAEVRSTLDQFAEQIESLSSLAKEARKKGEDDERARIAAHILADIAALEDEGECEDENGVTTTYRYSDEQIRFGKKLLNSALVSIQETDWWPEDEYVEAADVLLTGNKPSAEV